MLDALEPLRELADQESEQIRVTIPKQKDSNGAWASGQQTERYLKRYIEIFREQSFAIISMYKSIFPSEEQVKGLSDGPKTAGFLLPMPSALSTFPLHLIELLSETLRLYLPNVRDKGSRESLLTQVLYCAGSLGRLGGDFSMVLASLVDTDEDGGEEWAEVIKKHRVLAGRLELLASGVGAHSGSGGPRESSPVK